MACCACHGNDMSLYIGYPYGIVVKYKRAEKMPLFSRLKTKVYISQIWDSTRHGHILESASVPIRTLKLSSCEHG